jgi:hypothetical protein
MAGKTRSIPRKDLLFMANDIGPELVELMEPEDILKKMNPKKRKALLSLLTSKARLADLTPEERLAGLTPEEFLTGMSPEKQKAFWDSLLKIYPAAATDEKHPNGESNY